MSNLEAKISLQMNRHTYIKSTYMALECKEPTFSTLQLQTLKVKLDLIDNNWQKFEATHERMAESKAELLLDHDYLKKKVYDQCLLYYADAKAALLTQIEEKKRTHPLSGSQLANLSIGGQSSARRHLPEITLPQFSGDFSAWRPFHDLFSSLVGRNADISNVEKMHYLRTSLMGEAAQLISNLPVSEDSFASAWDLLVSRYENKRLLISAQVDRLFRTKTISQRSAKELNSLLNTTTEALNALESLGVPVQHWDYLLVHLTVQRLDPSTREVWEVKLGSTTDPPTYKDIRTFLTGRARAMESMEFGTSSSSPADKPASLAPRQTSKTSAATAHVAISPPSGISETFGCALCSGPHYIVSCPRFKDMSAHLRRNIVIDKRLCFNCLGRHNAVACQNLKRCRECGNKHHTMIHMDSQPPPRLSTMQDKMTPSTTATQTSAPASPSKSTSTSASEILIDPGSELTFASGQLINTLQIPRRYASIPIIGIDESHLERTRGVVPLTLHSIHSSQSISVTAYILKKLTTSLPSMMTTEYHWPHLHGLQLADPDFLTPGPIDLILGADSYGSIIQPDIIKGSEEELIAQLTIFGWIVLAPISAPFTAVHRSNHVAVDHELHDLLTKFWIQEEVASLSTTPLNPDEEKCETQFKATHSQDRAGRYVVRLPLKLQASQLGESRSTAQRCLQRTLRRLSTDPTYQKLYSSFIPEYEELQHMVRVPPSTPEPSPVFYLPHHGVLRDDSITTKLRVVFNGSSLTSTGSSLNLILHTGAKLQPDISDVLLWVRRYRYIFITDITKMFRQIQVHPADWDLQRILWVDN